ncbi:MAG: phosphatase PAP2 family protein [candidate division KSB1 bacterium]|nr:phosphatase PAP2 family protein [candidate division KSB1 bacterium]MDZ7295735.1 phosphatase PAP2 family protein [candidate division KSB1 bacterium]MDZ7377836.1 phosphatase PAP2 family protein [candidate division KSB1 bacterium]MDZ7384662.1 phosphatase PAP2 family protein [candidate division KSB1 bacterium]MDZ7393084.1 phosphatase PAP2 family protein [candidate division KSB1 bacterium]
MQAWTFRLDAALFSLINQTLANPQFDVLMPFLTDIDNWRLIIALALLALCLFGGRKGRLATLLLVVTVTMTDQTSSHLLKPLVERTRPCHVLPNVRLLVGCSGAFSFPSSHAANLFGAAWLLWRFYRPLWPLFFLLASFVSYSRVYVGVHYPSDVLAGAVLGILCACTVEAVSRSLILRYTKLG